MAKKKTNGKGQPPTKTSWKPGESGNPGGQPSRKQWSDALRLAANRPYKDPETGKESPDLTNLAKVAEGVIEDALNKVPWAVQELGNRLEGRPITFQNVAMADEPFQPEETEEETIFQNAKYFASAVQQAMGDKKGKGKPH